MVKAIKQALEAAKPQSLDTLKKRLAADLAEAEKMLNEEKARLIDLQKQAKAAKDAENKAQATLNAQNGVVNTATAKTAPLQTSLNEINQAIAAIKK